MESMSKKGGVMKIIVLVVIIIILIGLILLAVNLMGDGESNQNGETQEQGGDSQNDQGSGSEVDLEEKPPRPPE